MRAPVQDRSIPTEVVKRQVQRILQSEEFSGSEVLRNLLSFLTTQSIERPGEPVKEYELAVAVLGKPDGFDPRLDSAVRVHAARLRSKLAEYYMADGSEDSVLIEVPRGSYQVTCRYRSLELVTVPKLVSVAPPPVVRFSWKAFAIGAAAALLCSGILGVSLYLRTPRLPRPVAAFWQPFLNSPGEPLIVFSNHRFSGTQSTGLFRFREGVDSPAERNDTYSGTGTVMSVGELTSIFSLAGHSPRLKRAELLTWDEAKDSSVVFVGAPDANSRLRELAPLHHLRFKSGLEEPNIGHGGIINLHPATGEQAYYFGPPGLPYTFDYAVVALLPSIAPERKAVVLAGTNTYGCQAACEFLTHSESLADLARRLGVPKNARIPDFEALLKVTVNGGVPTRTEIVLARRD